MTNFAASMSADQPVVFYSAGEGRLSYVNCRPYVYITRASHPYRRPSPGTTAAGLAVQRRSCVLLACLICTLLAAYQDSECMSCLYLTDCWLSG